MLKNNKFISYSTISGRSVSIVDIFSPVFKVIQEKDLIGCDILLTLY